MKLTRDSVSKLALAPGERQRFVRDDDLKGFGIRMRPAKSSWIIQYRCNRIHQRRMSIGSVTTLGADAARNAAKAHPVAATLGNDPKKERAETRIKNAVRFGPQSKLIGPDHRASAIRESTLSRITRDLKVKWKPLHPSQTKTRHLIID